MCLAIPKQIISVNKDSIKVLAGKRTEQVGSLIKVKKGDWVLTQNKIIIRKITSRQAREVKQLLKV